MKRFLCLILALVLLPVVSLAVPDESALIGCWVSLDNQYSEANFVRMIVFYDNHIAYCTMQDFYFNSKLDKNPVTQSLVKWEYQSGCIFLTDTETGKESRMYLLDDNCISYTQKRSGNLYHKVNNPESDDLPLSQNPTGKDPIIGSWYIMLDYKEAPQTGETAGKNYMLYIMIFEESGTISAISGESLESSGLYANGSAVGTWSKDEDGRYTVNILGLGSNKAEISGDRLLVQMTQDIWYSMQRMNMGGWYTDMILRY